MIKKTIFVYIIVFHSISAYSQALFQKGYFVTNENEKISCFIKNMDWRNNPSEFKYQVSEGSEIKMTSIDDVIEFGILIFTRDIR